MHAAKSGKHRERDSESPFAPDGSLASLHGVPSTGDTKAVFGNSQIGGENIGTDHVRC